MTRIDGTKNLRQMMVMPNLLPLCGVLLAFLFHFISYWGAPFHRGCHHPFYALPETINGQMVPYDCLPTVYIDMYGEMHLGDDRKIEPSEFSLRLEDDIDEKKSPNRIVTFKSGSKCPVWQGAGGFEMDTEGRCKKHQLDFQRTGRVF